MPSNPLRRVALLDVHWMIEELYANAAYDEMSQIEITPEIVAASRARSGRGAENDLPYDLINGVAVIRVEGPLTKQATCMSWLFGGTSTVETQQAVAQAGEDKQAQEILCYFDTPGGQVAGTFDCADEIARVNAIKPVIGYVSDLCASAGYALASQCGRIYANRTALIGSIGTYMTLQDTSAIAEQEGRKIHVVKGKGGKYKGAGVPGTVISKDHLDEFQRNVDALNAQFVQTVANGRKMTTEQVEEIADGRVHIAESALALGLIDEIASLQEVIASLQAQRQQSTSVRW